MLDQHVAQGYRAARGEDDPRARSGRYAVRGLRCRALRDRRASRGVGNGAVQRACGGGASHASSDIHRRVAVGITEPLPRDHENTGRWPSGEPTQPWALELTDGSHCELAGDATSVADGMRLNYFCAPDKLSLYGDPDRGSTVWTIYGGVLNASQLTQRTIAIAWF